MIRKTSLIVLTCIVSVSSQCQVKKVHSKKGLDTNNTNEKVKPILPGAYQIKEYLPLLHGKRVGIFANQTSTIAGTHLVDTLIQSGVTITKIFGPEHGFRGTSNAGEKIDNYIDKATGIPVISLYGNKKKPTKADLDDVDLLIFDIQDVGVRFYTFISSMEYFMESAIEYNKPLLIFDRPNPNGFYVDGPVLDTGFKSFVGMQAVPVVYGMTIGEYANYLIGEGLLDKNIMAAWMMRIVNDTSLVNKDGGNGLNITVIKCRNYTHKRQYILPEKPSPNLPDMAAIYCYPSTCFFEGTIMSEGRGTEHPFQIFGHPKLPDSLYSFTPVANEGASNPKLKNQKCFGWKISGTTDSILKEMNNHLQLKYLLNAYKLFPDKNNFFLTSKKENVKPTDYFFNKLAGNAQLMQQIIDGKSEEEIRASWQPKLSAFKKIRKKYLMYEDFE